MSSVVIKLGSSVVAEDDGTIRTDVLDRICDDVAALYTDGYEPIIVTSGAIARGLGVMKIAPGQRPRAIDELQAASAIGQGKLYRVYDELLQARGIPTAQVLLTFFDMSARTHYLNVRHTLAKLLDWRVVPVINENDTTTTDEISFGDNDFLAAQVAILVGAERLLLLTNTDGVFTADPRTHAEARLVSQISAIEELEALQITQTASVLGSGGMRSKVVAAEMATAAGIPAVIANGQIAGTISAAVLGQEVGTTFLARVDRVSSFKLWLKYAKPARGRVRVDAGAARALREGGTSLLPVGVIDISGDFEAGDAIEVTFGDEQVGKGISNYSAEDLQRVRGMKSAQVRELLPRSSDEAVHRDYFVLA
ncbi:MAG TPA: glutamate 5-kinase [Solirubrobacteraceae bacterium]|nr:glutamate 5-kinase [Solirubrobacteraceae bacterium]